MQASRPPIHRGGAEATRRSSQVSEGPAIRTPDSYRLIREVEQRLRTVVSNAPVILFAFDGEGIMTLSEGAGLEPLGIIPGESVGTSVFDRYKREPGVINSARRALDGEEVTEVITVKGNTFAVRYSPQLDESGEVVQVIGVATDITLQERAESELRRRVEFDSLIHRAFTTFIEIAPDDSKSPKQLDEAILEALADVGRFTGSARTYILEKSDDGTSLSTTYEWCSRKTELAVDGLRDISTAAIPWVVEQINAGKPVHVPAIDDLEPEIASQLRHLGCPGVQSMVNLPLVTRGLVQGLVGFEWIHPSSQVGVEDEVSQLAVMQDLFANALQQRRVGGALQRVNRLLRAVLECSDALTRARDEKVLLYEVCRIVVEVGGFRQAWVGFGLDDEEKSILPVAQWGYDEGYVESLNITWDDTDKGQGPMGKAIRTRTPASIPNIATDVDFEPWRAAAINRGCRSALAVPLVFGDELLGAIIVYSVVPSAFDTLEVEILQRFAGYLSYGIGALRSQARRELAEGQLRDSLRSKEQLVATISHEMRTPLTAVVGFADLLQVPDSGLSDEERIEMIRSIADEGRDLTNIVDDLMTAAKAEAGTLAVLAAPVDLRALASQVLETMRQGQPVEITGDSVRGSGDPSRVRQILRNLISNALRYGGDDIRICIFDSPTPRAEVRDNGDGIPAEERERVFDAYQRAHDAPGLTASMGLGLTISRSLARLMGGDLTYRFEGGESVFELQLPALHLNRVLSEVTVTPDFARR